MNLESEKIDSHHLNGSLLKIYTYPAKILKKKAIPVKTFDDDLRTFIKDMLFTMYQAPGIGLAAPQVGRSERIFVIDIDYEREKIIDEDGKEAFKFHSFNPHVFINPKITKHDGEILYEEGCLSVPGVYEEVKRFENITVEYHDQWGELKTLTADSTLSVCIQHENDHLNGVLFIEKLSLIKRQLVTKKYLKNKDKK